MRQKYVEVQLDKNETTNNHIKHQYHIWTPTITIKASLGYNLPTNAIKRQLDAQQ